MPFGGNSSPDRQASSIEMPAKRGGAGEPSRRNGGGVVHCDAPTGWAPITAPIASLIRVVASARESLLPAEVEHGSTCWFSETLLAVLISTFWIASVLWISAVWPLWRGTPVRCRRAW